MTVWALADLHLALGTPDKAMDVFGEPWIDYTDKIKSRWLNTIQPEDLILIPGDISWALKLEQARVDLDWIHQLPGTKILLRGNHDYWWASLKQIQAILPPSIHLIQNNAFHWKDVSIAGSRLWDTTEYKFQTYINYINNPRAKGITEEDRSADSEMIFKRELSRLETSLKGLSNGVRIAMTHYPPISGDLKESQASALLEKYHVDICVFGHLHNVKKEIPLFGKKNGISYYLTSADYLDFTPLKIYENLIP